MKYEYLRDIWILGPASTSYPGSFPKGLISRIKERWWGNNRLWLFSGSFKDPGGTTVDIKPEVTPDVVADAQDLPFEDGVFDFVMADPPYSEDEALTLYNTPYPSMVKVLNEMARVTDTGGHMILLHRLYPQHHSHFSEDFKRMQLKAIVGVCTIAAFSNIRALTVWQKQPSLFEFGKDAPPRGIYQ